MENKTIDVNKDLNLKLDLKCDKKISVGAKKLYFFLDEVLDGRDPYRCYCADSNDCLAKDYNKKFQANVKPQTVARWIKKLAEKGYLYYEIINNNLRIVSTKTEFVEFRQQANGFRVNGVFYSLPENLMFCDQKFKLIDMVMHDRRIDFFSKSIFVYLYTTFCSSTFFPSQFKACCDLTMPPKYFLKYFKKLVDFGFFVKRKFDFKSFGLDITDITKSMVKYEFSMVRFKSKFLETTPEKSGA